MLGEWGIMLELELRFLNFLVFSMRFSNPIYNQQMNDESDANAPILQPGQHEYLNPHFGSSPGPADLLRSK